MIIHVEYGDRNSIVELTEMERSQLIDYVKNEDQIHGFDVSDDRKYNSDDYLYVVSLVQEVVSAYFISSSWATMISLQRMMPSWV